MHHMGYHCYRSCRCNVLEVIGGGKFNVLSFVIGLIVPGLYIYGAFLNHKENAR